MYSHQYKICNTDDLILQKDWITITKFMLDKARFIRVKYWPDDTILSLQNKDYLATTFGIDSLRKYSIKTLKIECNMEEMVCPVNAETKHIILQINNSQSNIHNQIISWFHIELLNDIYNIVLYSGDFGHDILLNISVEEEMKLKELLIKPANLTRFKFKTQ
ncbi:hypothetical protein Desku_2818 [Desulfofundulus kuznetsovii DSM 6115]|uniref:Uncharacterized protein n=1 Tax=Desulfofundulus kuznetsovii (strain DSM 6115 / VKM B-1805 / 17) TaxID=760568 RepID=A0AAU8PSA9_DESK7|nr:hypothetical protein Desku_2818 [Desulfofundulus kuznetsovii DSM 6115]